MRRVLYHAAWLLALACIFTPAKSYWQSRDSNYNQSIPASGGTVTTDQIMTDNGSTRSASGVTSFSGSGSITITGGLTNPALVVGIIQCDGVSNITGVTAVWDSGASNQSMTQIGTASQLSITGLWFGLRNPVSGAKNLAISWTNAAQIKITGVSFSGVNSGSDAAAFKNFTSAANASPITVNITSGTGHKTVAVMGSISNFTSVNNTQTVLDNGCLTWAAAGNLASGPGSVAMTASPGSAVTSIAVGMDVSP